MKRDVDAVGRTDIGKVRHRNEDALLVRSDAGLWAVADGLGGHASGDYASQLIISRLSTLSRTGDTCDFIDAVDDAVAAVNAELRAAARAQSVDAIASTLAVLVRASHRMLCGWIGDSRVYRYAGGTLQQLTQDHLFGNFASARWEGGQQRPQPGNGKLARAIGAGDRVTVDWTIATAGEGSCFLLCTDGINKEMSDADIATVCGRLSEPAAIVDELFRITLDRGARDNLSAIAVHAPTGDAGAFDLESANRELRLLNAANYRGEIDRQTYRTRRRELLRAAPSGGSVGYEKLRSVTPAPSTAPLERPFSLLERAVSFFRHRW